MLSRWCHRRWSRAHAVEGVYWIRCRSSSGKGLVPNNSRSAFDCDFPTLVGVSEFACVLSILNLGGLWFLAGPSTPPPLPKKKNLSLKGTLEVYLFRHLVASLLMWPICLFRDQVSKVPSVACLRVWGRLLVAKEMRMRSGWSSPGSYKFNFFGELEGLRGWCGVIDGSHSIFMMWWLVNMETFT